MGWIPIFSPDINAFQDTCNAPLFNRQVLSTFGLSAFITIQDFSAISIYTCAPSSWSRIVIRLTLVHHPLNPVLYFFLLAKFFQ